MQGRCSRAVAAVQAEPDLAGTVRLTTFQRMQMIPFAPEML